MNIKDKMFDYPTDENDLIISMGNGKKIVNIKDMVKDDNAKTRQMKRIKNQ